MGSTMMNPYSLWPAGVTTLISEACTLAQIVYLHFIGFNLGYYIIRKRISFFFVFFFHIHSINHNPTSLNVFVYVYLVDLFTRSFHLFISLVHFTYSYVYSSILLVHFNRTLHLLTSFVHFTCSFHSSISLAHYSRPFHYFTLSISPGITPGSMPPNSRSLHEEGATFISFFIVRNGEFKEKGNIYKFTFIQFISISVAFNYTFSLSDRSVQAYS